MERDLLGYRSSRCQKHCIMRKLRRLLQKINEERSMSERDIEWAGGFYDQFHQMLYDGEIDSQGVQELYDENLITKYQYEFGMDYLKKV